MATTRLCDVRYAVDVSLVWHRATRDLQKAALRTGDTSGVSYCNYRLRGALTLGQIEVAVG